MKRRGWCFGFAWMFAALVSGVAIHAQDTLPSGASLLPAPFPGFDRISRGEALQPRFDLPGGKITSARYTGFVEVFVSGTGLNNTSEPDVRSDAFYNFRASGNTSLGLFDNTLRLGSETPIQPLPMQYGWIPNSSLHVEAGSLHVAGLAILYEGPSFATSGAVPLDVQHGNAPAFNPTHTYHFVMNLGCYLGKLTLGFGDGGTIDNSRDTYGIALWQVVASSR